MVVPNRLPLKLHKSYCQLEEFSTKLFLPLEDRQILREDKGELFSAHAGQDGRFGEGVNEELLGVGLQGEELGEDSDPAKEDETILVVALAAVPQDLQTQVNDLTHED